MPALALDLTRAPADAVEFFDAKGNRLTWDWRDMLREDHDLAFTVSKATSEEVLGAIRTQVAKAIGQGMTFQQFKRTLKPTLQDLGWWGRQDLLDGETGELTQVQLGSDRRLRTIYSTNIQTAYMAGRYKRMVGNAVDRPYWRYVPIMDGRTRPKHRELNGFVARWDSPVWRLIFPPNGFGCRCRVVAMTAAEFAASGLKLSDDANLLVTKEVDLRDGSRVQVTGLKGVLPDGGDFFPDVGWDYNPGDYQAAAARLESIQEEKALQAKRAERNAKSATPVSAPPPASKPSSQDFNVRSTAGKWHKMAWSDSPDWLRHVVVREQAVSVQAKSANAWARGGSLIDMDGHQQGSLNSQSVWRHEFGHALDWRLGGGRNYISSTHPELKLALQADIEPMRAVLQDPGYAAHVQQAVDRITAAPDRAAALADMAVAASLDWNEMHKLVEQSTVLLDAAVGDQTGIGSARVAGAVARMIVAIERSSVQHLADAAASVISENMWTKDGALSALCDLAGSVSRNVVCPAGKYPGHTTNYYNLDTRLQWTEAFANLTALAGHPNSYWWVIISRLFPKGSQVYEHIIRNA